MPNCAAGDGENLTDDEAGTQKWGLERNKECKETIGQYIQLKSHRAYSVNSPALFHLLNKMLCLRTVSVVKQKSFAQTVLVK
jgi:hypothetical protein